jgi:hypothetical protein
LAPGSRGLADVKIGENNINSGIHGITRVNTFGWQCPWLSDGQTAGRLSGPASGGRVHTGEWISQLRRVFDVAWATAWNDDANRLLAPLLGIAPIPVVIMPPPPDPRFHCSLAADIQR